MTSTKRLLTGIAFIAAALAVPVVSAARDRWDSSPVDVEIIDGSGRAYPQYPVKRGERLNIYRAYLEADCGERYAIRVRNVSGYRLGLVIAVDGRNIISGDRSYLSSRERMYVLRPGEEEVYSGWRTGRQRVNRFYFTDAGDSYAEAWGDSTAMGVIALAVYREQEHYEPSYGLGELRKPGRPGEAPSAEFSRRSGPREEAGTGFGEEESSPSRNVSFEPEASPVAKYFVKYEWRDTLCRKGIIRCERGGNRFWHDDEEGRDYEEGYAPAPPRHRY